MSASESDLYQFGTVVGTHGIRGDLKVRPYNRGSDLLCSAADVVLRRESDGDSCHAVARAVSHKGNVLLRLKGLENINLVGDYIGSDVLMFRRDLSASDDMALHADDVDGYEVYDRRCGLVGTIDGSFSTAAHEIYVVQGPYGEVLMPVVDRFITEIDIAGRRMTVDLPEGLVPVSDED